MPLYTQTEEISNFIEITLRHGSSPVNLLHIFKTAFPRDTSGWLLLKLTHWCLLLTLEVIFP